MYQYSAESKAQLEKARNYLKTNKRVKRFYSIWEAWYSILRGDINPYDNSRLYDMSFQNESIFVDKYKFIATQDITYTAHLLDDEDFNALCKKNGIDYKKYYSPDKDGSIKTIVINGIDRNDEPIFNNNLLGKTIGCYDIDSEKTERENKLDESVYMINILMMIRFISITVLKPTSRTRLKRNLRTICPKTKPRATYITIIIG